MNYIVVTYLLYLAISVTLTVWVAKTLHNNGRIFLVDAFHGNEPLADSINHLLLVGFYLINIGYVSLALKYGDKRGGPARRARSAQHQDRRRAARPRRDALLQPLRLLEDAEPRAAPRRAAAAPAAAHHLPVANA